MVHDYGNYHTDIYYITQRRCPIGFIKYNDECQCEPSIREYNIECDINDQTILHPANSWISATTHNNSYTYHFSLHCPFQYCLPHSSHLNLSTPNSQCWFNISGVLCSHCQKGFSSIFTSSHCHHCSNINLFFIAPIMIAGFALVILLFCINLTVGVGLLNPFILYANIVLMLKCTFPMKTNFLLLAFSYHLLILICIRGVARLINWCGTAGPLTALIECLTVILEYIDLFQFLLVGHSQLVVGPGPYQAHHWLRL